MASFKKWLYLNEFLFSSTMSAKYASIASNCQWSEPAIYAHDWRASIKLQLKSYLLISLDLRNIIPEFRDDNTSTGKHYDQRILQMRIWLSRRFPSRQKSWRNVDMISSLLRTIVILNSLLEVMGACTRLRLHWPWSAESYATRNFYPRVDNSRNSTNDPIWRRWSSLDDLR